MVKFDYISKINISNHSTMYCNLMLRIGWHLWKKKIIICWMYRGSGEWCTIYCNLGYLISLGCILWEFKSKSQLSYLYLNEDKSSFEKLNNQKAGFWNLDWFLCTDMFFFANNKYLSSFFANNKICCKMGLLSQTSRILWFQRSDSIHIWYRAT